MFGTDTVGGHDQAAYLRWVRAFTEIPSEVEAAGIRFTPEELAALRGGPPSGCSGYHSINTS